MLKKLIFRLIPVFFGFILGAGITAQSPAVFNKVSKFLGSEAALCSCEGNCACDCGCFADE